jgi:hypothetical protein
LDPQPRVLEATPSLATARFARIYSNLFSPPLVSAVLGFVIAWAELSFWPGLMWGAMFGILISLVPVLVVVYLLKTGRVGDLHMRQQRERHLPYLISFAGAGLALFVTFVVDGSPLLRGLAVCNVIGLGALGLINVYWLISNHSATMMMATTFVGIAFGALAGLTLTPLVALTVWARLSLRRHTPAQLVAGLLVGAAPVLILANLGYLR